MGGSLVYAASGLWFLLVPGPEFNYVKDWLPGLILRARRRDGAALLSGAAVAHLPASHYAVGSAFNQATRQIGGVLGVAVTVLLLTSDQTADIQDFAPTYFCHIGLALFTGMLCLAVDTRPRAV